MRLHLALFLLGDIKCVFNNNIRRFHGLIHISPAVSIPGKHGIRELECPVSGFFRPELHRIRLHGFFGGEIQGKGFIFNFQQFRGPFRCFLSFGDDAANRISLMFHMVGENRLILNVSEHIFAYLYGGHQIQDTSIVAFLSDIPGGEYLNDAGHLGSL